MVITQGMIPEFSHHHTTMETAMQYSVLIEAVADPDFPQGYYYAYIPSLGLTTHGLGIEGAKVAARDLIGLWVAEKKLRGEFIAREVDSYFSHIGIEDALVSA
uniref:Predicted nuclease of the RNAse H fold, HicB family n=1 Tax=Candidatus Kentrum sp. LPFa TaxID=2126335 RepID=A0A450WSN6_9GAMM|nr:MAG: Predicted nuclease of the RNAse H fold, HicB family [Candidatus Kentron sp. LPFa]VFK34093.1 MAG: Predicted nuclease of the RNAse H fold, HicB family [Candidatus Kentron sp. LPFa]